MGLVSAVLPNANLESLLARLHGLAFRLDRGECPPGEEMERLAAEASALGPDLSYAERARLSDAVARVGEALAASSARIRERLTATNIGRRASRAYAGAAP